MNAKLSELPYYASVWEAEHLLGHGSQQRKLFNAIRIEDSPDFDATYKLIASIHRQNILLQRMLDNDEDKDVDEPKPKRKAAPKRAPKQVPVAEVGPAKRADVAALDKGSTTAA